MKIEINDVVTLEDNKEYICFNIIKEENIKYLYLISNFTPTEVKFAKEIKENEDTYLEIINNKEEKEKVYTLLGHDALKTE